MATQPIDDIEDDPELDLEEEDDAPDDGDDAVEEEGDDKPVDEDEDQVIVGDDRATAEEETEGMRNLRNRLKEREREIRELRGQPQDTKLRTKPTLEDHGYDDEQYEADLEKWFGEKIKVDQAEAQQREAGQRAQQKWEQQHGQFESGWNDLRVSGKDAARAKVEETFTDQQQALLIKASRGNAPALFFAIGSNQDRLRALKDLVDDPAEFIAEAAIIAKETKVTKRPANPPEQRHASSGGTIRNSDAKMERLEKEASNTADYSKLVAYRASLKGKN